MSEIFCVQDRTGTAAQLVLEAAPTETVEVNDTGAYTGRDHKGTEVVLDFTVKAVNDQQNICISTMTPTEGPGNVLESNWPKFGTITWLTGANSASSPDSTVVLKRYPANAYITTDFFFDYHLSRGVTYPDSPIEPVRRCIVKATDYLNQKYRYKGNKLLQYLSSPINDPFILYIDPWLIPAALGSAGLGIPGSRSPAFAPAFTSQYTEWPRQGVVDFNGDDVYGIPNVVMEACAIGAGREMDGTPLQPDYDPELVGNGGIVVSVSEEIGPIKESRTFDTKLGIGFFPDIPQIRRMLAKAGILNAGGGRTIIR